MKISEKQIWNDSHFDHMNWHDNYIHSFILPDENLIFELDIDYILQWIKKIDSNLFKFKVAPARLKFYDVLGLNINLVYENSTGINIDSISRRNRRLSPNNKKIIWNYFIETDKGIISFESTGYSLTLSEKSQIIDSQRLKR